jgi:hypothetical protein
MKQQVKIKETGENIFTPQLTAVLPDRYCTKLLKGEHPTGDPRRKEAYNSARLSITRYHWLIIIWISTAALERLESFGIGELDKLDLCSLQPICNRVALLDQLVHSLGVASDPYASDGIPKDFSEPRLIQIWLRNRRKEDSPRGDAVGVDWREQEGLTKVDVEDRFPSNQGQDEAEEDYSGTSAAEVSVLAARFVLVNVCHREQIKFPTRAPARDVDGEENRPCDAGSNEHDNHRHSKESEKEVGIEGLMLKSVGIGDFPYGWDPIEVAGGQVWRTLPMAN